MKHQILNLEKHAFMQAINPNIVTENKGILYYNTGIWGSDIDNAMPQYLADLVNSSSSLHSNLCNLKFNQIQGNNLELADDSMPNADEQAAFISKRNKSGDNLKAVYSKCARDFSIFEAAAIQVLFDRNGKVAEIYHVPLHNVRMQTPNAYNQIDFYYISQYWADITNTRYKKKTTNNSAVRVRAYNPQDYREFPVQLLYISRYNPTTWYSIPMYASSIGWILMDNYIANYNLGNLKTNYFIAGMLTMQGNPTPEEMRDFISDFQALYKQDTGSPNVSKEKLIFSWVDDLGAQAPQFTPFQSTQYDFDALLSKVESRIITGHNAYPEMAGLNTKSADLGGTSSAIYAGLMAFQQLVTEPMKNVLLDGFNYVLNTNDFNNNLVVTTDVIRTQQPIAMEDDLTLEERRRLIYNLDTKKESVVENKTEDIINTNQ
jgi:hypothetical protein